MDCWSDFGQGYVLAKIDVPLLPAFAFLVHKHLMLDFHLWSFYDTGFSFLFPYFCFFFL
jgi:hypothetical protein